MGCHPRKAVELPGHHTEIFLRQFCLSCCLAFSCVVTFRRGKCREREWGEGARVKRQQRAMLGCVASHPSKWQERERERERERAGNFLQTSCENTRNRKLLRKTLNAMLARPSACPLLSPSAVFSSSSSSVSASGPVPQLTALTALSSQFSVRPPLCVCLSVCLFGSSFRLPVSVSVSVAVSVSSALSPSQFST